MSETSTIRLASKRINSTRCDVHVVHNYEPASAAHLSLLHHSRIGHRNLRRASGVRIKIGKFMQSQLCYISRSLHRPVSGSTVKGPYQSPFIDDAWINVSVRLPVLPICAIYDSK